MKRLNYLWKEAGFVLLGLFCGIVTLILGACFGAVIDANEVAGFLTTVAYLMLMMTPHKKGRAEAVLMPLTVTCLALALNLGWWTWIVVWGLTVFHVYFIEKSREFVAYIDLAAIASISLFFCGILHLCFWLFSLL